MSKKMTERETLKQVYLTVVESWAVGAGEIADAIDLSVSRVNTVLRKLEAKRLVASTHVNNERALTWQSHFDIENEEDVVERATAAFDEAYPEEVKAGTTHAGATGARYTPEQIEKGVKLRGAGMAWKQIAAECGVKSPGYFSKTIQAEIAKRTAAAKKAVARPAKKATGRKPAAKKATARKRSGLRVTGDGPEALKELFRLS